MTNDELWEQYLATLRGEVAKNRAKLLKALSGAKPWHLPEFEESERGRAWNEIVDMSRHRVLFTGMFTLDLDIMVRDFNKAYDTQVGVEDIVKDAEIWVLSRGMGKAGTADERG